MDLREFQRKFKEMEDFINNYISDIEKGKDKSYEYKKPDYENITNIAKKYPLKRKALKGASELMKKEYITSLTYFLTIGENTNFDKLLYICRISEGLKLDSSAEDICNAAMRFDGNDIEKVCEELIEYKFSYLVDALIIANIKGEADKKILSLIADIAGFMSCSKEEVRVIALVAKTALTNNAYWLKDVTPFTGNIWIGMFSDFIPEKWIEAQRKFCATINYDEYGRTSVYNPTDKTLYKCVIKTQMKSEDVVKKGDIILDYEVKSKNEIPNKYGVKLEGTKITRVVIKAPCNGVVLAINFTDKPDKDKFESVFNHTDIYVTSCFDDYDKFISLIRKKNLIHNAINLFASKAKSLYNKE